MYFVYVAGLVFGLYLAPGLAIAPRAAFDSRLAFTLPIISVLVVTTCARILKPLGLFSQTVVLFATLGFALAAEFRLFALYRRSREAIEPSHWPPAHRLVYLFSACVALPIAARLGTSGFEVDDENL